jgi:hypothetical protein
MLRTEKTIPKSQKSGRDKVHSARLYPAGEVGSPGEQSEILSISYNLTVSVTNKRDN